MIVDINEVTNMSSSARNKLLIENPVISTLHFSKRMDKIFRYFQTTDAFKPYRMADYFFRIEFQARGAPHLHSLIYLEEERINEESGEMEWKPVKSMSRQIITSKGKKLLIVLKGVLNTSYVHPYQISSVMIVILQRIQAA